MMTIYHATECGNNENPYTAVAVVDTDNIHDAFRATQNIDESWCDWDDKRSTSSGDVICDGKDHWFLVPLGNGRGSKSYKTHGRTVKIDNFDINGFTYNEDIK